MTREEVPNSDADVGLPSTDPTAGSPGDVEVGVNQSPATGSEATETWRQTERRPTEVVRDETGEGRRSP